MRDSISTWRSALPFFIFCIICLLSLPVKWIAAQHMVWEMDYIPLFTRGLAFFESGTFPAYGTLSSVAAYNMPFLVWMQMPVMGFTRDPFMVFFLTQLFFNLLTTWVIYRCGTVMFSVRTGLLAAVFFAFSETGISSSYTAWAQLLLPGFFVMVFYCVWQWITLKRGLYLMLAGVIATAAFMTHFAAVMLYPGMFVIAVLIGARWQWRWLLAGAMICLLMLAPYMLFQIERDFVDVQAFLRRDTLVDPAIMAQYDNLKPGGNFEAYIDPDSILDEDDSFGTTSDVVISPETAESNTSISSSTSPGYPQRILQFIVSVPGQYLQALRIPYMLPARSLLSPLNLVFDGFNTVFAGLVYISLIVSVFIMLRAIWTLHHRTLTEIRGLLKETISGRVALLFIFILTVISLYILTRASPYEQPTYYNGLISLQFLIIAVALDTVSTQVFSDRRLHTGLLIVVAVMFMGVNSVERLERVRLHDDTMYSAFNSWLYEHVNATATWIASDWQSVADPVISYDILPEMRHMWWVLPWHTVDNLYRMGTPYDVLLAVKHGISNANQAVEGLADAADYIIVYEPGLSRYMLDDYEIAQFGTTYILKRKS